MSRPRAVSDLDFYRALRHLDLKQPDIRAALAFARVFTHLAQRVLAAQATYEEEEVHWPPSLGLPALLAYVENGRNLTSAQFVAAAPTLWNGAPVAVLADLASWLAPGFDAKDPFASAFQVWIDPGSSGTVSLYGKPSATAPPPPFRLLEAPPAEAWFAATPGSPAAVIAHYDVHGLTMLGLTLRYLRKQKLAQVDCACGFEWTGDIGKLWKRAVPKTIAHPNEYGAVVLIDCSVHSRHPQRTLKAIARLDAAPHCRLIVVDHHPDTFTLAPRMRHERLCLALTDVLSCGLTDCWDTVESQLMILGALGDKDPEANAAFPPETHGPLHMAASEYHRRAIHFSPTPPAMKQEGRYPLAPLWEALADGRPPTPELAGEVIGPLDPAEPLALPAHRVVGSLLLVTERIETVGRNWYNLLERLMAQSGAPYAAALRVLDNRRANVLLLTRWQAVHLPPIRHFIPLQYLSRCLGHPGAVWADLEKTQALPFLASVAQRLNSFAGTPGSLTEVTELLRRNILEAQGPSDEPDGSAARP